MGLCMCRLWVWCDGAMPGGYQCNHHAPFAVAPFVIRFGPMAPAERMLTVMRCGKCGHKGASFQHPSWSRDDSGMPFPAFPVGPRG